MNISTEQPMGIKHLIQHTGECQPYVFSHRTKWGLQSTITAPHVLKMPEKKNPSNVTLDLGFIFVNAVPFSTPVF